MCCVGRTGSSANCRRVWEAAAKRGEAAERWSPVYGHQLGQLGCRPTSAWAAGAAGRVGEGPPRRGWNRGNRRGSRQAGGGSGNYGLGRQRGKTRLGRRYSCGETTAGGDPGSRRTKWEAERRWGGRERSPGRAVCHVGWDLFGSERRRKKKSDRPAVDAALTPLCNSTMESAV
jgi:hypothetical protein